MEKTEQFSCEGYLHENYHYFHLRDTAGQERDFHFHEFDKVVLFFSGKVDYIVENQTYALQPWTVLLVKHHMIHKALIDTNEPYERIILYLDRRYFDRLFPDGQIMECFKLSAQRGNQLLKPTEEQRKLLESLIASYEKTQKSDEFGAQVMRDTIIMQMLVVIGRMGSAREPTAMPTCDPKIQETLSYINENLDKELNVDTLAEHVFLSKYHFMRLFKAQMGSTVHAYIRQKRLLCAARLIREGMSANHAAAKSGFSDYSAFHRAFKESFGVSPGQIKKGE